ncbi:MAG: hypothetical protein RLZZ399_612 [Verrucomicrobiota bacterium]|jgi:hypothetical protein
MCKVRPPGGLWRQLLPCENLRTLIPSLALEIAPALFLASTVPTPNLTPLESVLSLTLRAHGPSNAFG